MSALSLRVLGGDEPPKELPRSGVLVIGSSSARAGLVVSGDGVEDAHCAVGPIKGGGWAIKDLGSREGTLVNGKRVTSVRLAAGDAIVIGSRELRVVDPALPEKPPQRDPTPPPASLRDASNAAAAKAALALPKRIGGYRIERVLGRGGMGSVVLAVQESLGRPVALKILSPRLAADGDFVRRFQQEARAAAALSHPNVVVVHDVGEEGGLHYLSMEYMDKGSLEDRVRRETKLPWREVLDILHDAARGLMFAEERRIVHRDIKPANLMQNAAGTVKIADLGLATNLEAEATESEGKKIFGTPRFISPEQARGEPVDARSDLYSLGATAYQLLSGRTPFEGETTRDILRGHLTEPPPPLRALVPQIPEALEALVLRMLAKSPADRPASASALLSEVDRLRVAADHGVGPALHAPRKGVRMLAGALVVVLLAGAGFYFVRGGERGKPALADSGSSDTAALPVEPGGDGSLVTDDSELFQAPVDDGRADPVKDLEASLRERNLLAENAYLKINPALAPPERIVELERVAAEFAGTDRAALAAEEATRLRAEVAAEEAAALARSELYESAEELLRRRCALPTPPGELPMPGDQLRSALTFEGMAGLTPEEARSLAAKIEAEIVSAAVEAFRGALSRADALAAEGRFEEVDALLADLMPRFRVPDYAEGTAPAGLDELQALDAETRARAGRLASEIERWREERAEVDRASVAAELGNGGAVRAALLALDLAGAENGLATLEGELESDEVRALVGGLRSDVAGARSLLELLIAEFGRSGWRRRSISDPRSARPRDVVNASAAGLTVDLRGETEEIPWSAFAAKSDAVRQLVKDRLGRSYTAAEEAGVAGFLRIAAALEAAAIASSMLDPSAGAHFSDAEANALLAIFDELESWATTAPRLAREREAAALLTQALRDIEGESWSEAAAALEQLLYAFRDTLLVALLSDGSLIAEPETSPESSTESSAEASTGEGQ